MGPGPGDRRSSLSFSFFFNDTATTEIYTLSLHDALPIYSGHDKVLPAHLPHPPHGAARRMRRSEEHTSELQSRPHLVCRLLLENKKSSEILNIDAVGTYLICALRSVKQCNRHCLWRLLVNYPFFILINLSIFIQKKNHIFNSLLPQKNIFF